MTLRTWGPGACLLAMIKMFMEIVCVQVQAWCPAHAAWANGGKYCHHYHHHHHKILHFVALQIIGTKLKCDYPVVLKGRYL